MNQRERETKRIIKNKDMFLKYGTDNSFIIIIKKKNTVIYALFKWKSISHQAKNSNIPRGN